MAQTPGTLQGTLDLLILKTLVNGPNHGFGITLHIQTASGGLLSVEEGSLYPALHRLEREHVVTGGWKVTENGRRARYYRLTAKGRKRLEKAEESWGALSKGIARLLRYA